MNLIELTNVPDEKRDHQWETDFFVSITQSNLKLVHEAPQKALTVGLIFWLKRRKRPRNPQIKSCSGWR